MWKERQSQGTNVGERRGETVRDRDGDVLERPRTVDVKLVKWMLSVKGGRKGEKERREVYRKSARLGERRGTKEVKCKVYGGDAF